MAKFKIGDKIKHEKYGVGVIKDIDSACIDFYYKADFTGHGGDGTKVWLPKRIKNKVATKIA